MSYLAARPGVRAGAGEIARARSLSRALAAKILTQLAAAGLVVGRPGPGGGYTLARPARQISLLQIIAVVEQAAMPALCPFGPEWCGQRAPCPLHDAIVEMQERHRRFLEGTRLSAFGSGSVDGHSSTRPARRKKTVVKRRRPDSQAGP